MKRVTDFHYGNHHYVICYNGRYQRYFGIDSAWITDGKLNRSVNGFNGNVGRTLNECIIQCQITAMVADFKGKGYSLEESLRRVWEQLGHSAND